MSPARFLLPILLSAMVAVTPAAELTLTTPLPHQVVQRSSPGKGIVRLVGELSEEIPGKDAAIEARLVDAKGATGWQRVGGSISGKKLSGTFEAPAGGWWTLEVRVTREGKELALGKVGPVGVGEVFVVAGQSNSANYGEEKLTPQRGLVTAFDGTKWGPAMDPQPGASGNKGSFLPPLGDVLATKLGVPIGFVSCGIGATSVREWLPKGATFPNPPTIGLPKGATFPNPPTIESRVEKRPDGLWMSKGAAYETFLARMKALGPRGFRAVLWHQGESDANQKDPTRTLPGDLYRKYLETIIRESRRGIGWEVPWFVAQASYHVPGDEGSDDIRAAQASLARDGIALAGPDSDALKGDLRERNGQGVHFSGKGQRAHAAKWAETILPWLERLWTEPRTVAGGTEWSDFAQLPASHAIGWVGANVSSRDTKRWDGVLDEAKWGTPSPEQVVSRNWDWKISDEAWAAAVKEKGEGSREEVRFDLWLPEGVAVVKGMVVMSGHGSGESLFFRADLRALAKELGLGLFKFTGNPMQRGFWPRSLLFDRLREFGKKSGHPEVGHAPLFLYGHSNGTGFSAVFPAYEPERVWGWVSMRPGITFQVYQPGAAQVPGLVIFGEEDHFLARPSREENLAVVPALRKKHGALWNFAVEPKTGHGPGEKTWPLVYSFLRHTFAARVPADVDPRKGPVTLNTPAPESGFLGQNWVSATGGYQELEIATFAAFPGDKATASWLVNAAYAADWQAFQREGDLGPGR